MDKNNDPDNYVSCGGELTFAAEMETTIAFRDIPQCLEALCLRVFGAKPVFTDDCSVAEVIPLKRQYFYGDDMCMADSSESPDCTCWHDEGTGPLKDSPEGIQKWRDKPFAERMAEVSYGHTLEHAVCRIKDLERLLESAVRERDNAVSDHKQADTDTLRALHERNEARELLRRAMEWVYAWKQPTESWDQMIKDWENYISQ